MLNTLSNDWTTQGLLEEFSDWLQRTQYQPQKFSQTLSPFAVVLSFINTTIKMTFLFFPSSLYTILMKYVLDALVFCLVFLLMGQTVVLLQQFSISWTENIWWKEIRAVRLPWNKQVLFIWEISGQKELGACKHNHGKETSCVPAKVHVVSFTLLLVNA